MPDQVIDELSCDELDDMNDEAIEIVSPKSVFCGRCWYHGLVRQGRSLVYDNSGWLRGKKHACQDELQ